MWYVGLHLYLCPGPVEFVLFVYGIIPLNQPYLGNNKLILLSSYCSMFKFPGQDPALLPLDRVISTGHSDQPMALPMHSLTAYLAEEQVGLSEYSRGEIETTDKGLLSSVSSLLPNQG